MRPCAARLRGRIVGPLVAARLDRAPAEAVDQVGDGHDQKPRRNARNQLVDRGSHRDENDQREKGNDEQCFHGPTLGSDTDNLSAFETEMGTTLRAAGNLTAMPVAKDVPKQGPERLIHFVKQRLSDLGITQEELAARGGPDRSTLGKLRSRPGQQTPTVATLLAYDDTLGWDRGSAAVTLLGGTPQEAHSATSGAALDIDEKTARLISQADRHSQKLAELLAAVTAESDHLRRQLDALRIGG